MLTFLVNKVLFFLLTCDIFLILKQIFHCCTSLHASLVGVLCRAVQKVLWTSRLSWYFTSCSNASERLFCAGKKRCSLLLCGVGERKFLDFVTFGAECVSYYRLGFLFQEKLSSLQGLIRWNCLSSYYKVVLSPQRGDRHTSTFSHHLLKNCRASNSSLILPLTCSCLACCSHFTDMLFPN